MLEPLKNKSVSQESLLFDLVQRLGKTRGGRLAVHMHLSRLSKSYRRPRYLRIAGELFSVMAGGFEGQLFSFQNGDLFFVARGATRTILEAAVARVRLLFSQDPLLEQKDEKGDDAFCAWYDLETDYETLFALTRRYADDFEAARRKEEAERELSSPSLKVVPMPLKPAILDRLEQALERVDVSNIARRQTICTLIDESVPQPLFEEVFISIEDLQSVTTPGVDLLSDIWLFRYLTLTLDRRVMLLLIRDGVASTRPFSLNLNVETVLTPEFSRFEAAIAPMLRGRLVIEFNKLDVFSDMGAFLFARDYLHDKGFRLCLDGLTHHTLPFYNRARLGFDLVKLHWTPSGLEDMPLGMRAEVRNIIMETGQAHTILCRCDDERAIQTGQDLGIVMFQGRQVDRLLAAASRSFLH